MGKSLSSPYRQFTRKANKTKSNQIPTRKLQSLVLLHIYICICDEIKGETHEQLELTDFIEHLPPIHHKKIHNVDVCLLEKVKN